VASTLTNCVPLLAEPSESRKNLAASPSFDTSILWPSASNARYWTARFERRRVAEGTLNTMRNSAFVTWGSVEVIEDGAEEVVLVPLR